MIGERLGLELEVQRLELVRDQESLQVDRRIALDRFLRKEKGCQQWRILEFLKCGALRLIRDGATSPLTKATEKLESGDIVELQTPLPATCQHALSNIPTSQYRDYAFGHPKPSDDYEKGVLRYLAIKPQTTVLSDASVNSIAAFVRALKYDERVDHPIRHLVLASHASRSGLLKLPLQTGLDSKVITFEDLEALTGMALAIDPNLLEPRPKDTASKPIPASVHIKGCNIGNDVARPFLTLLKKTLGGQVKVTAPKFFHSLKLVNNLKLKKGKIISRKLAEIWEFFAYEFILVVPVALKDRPAAVAAFAKEFGSSSALKLIDGATIQQSDWQRWLPASLPANGKENEKSVPVKSALSAKANSAPSRLHYAKRHFLTNEWHSIALATDPGTTAGRLKEVAKQLIAADKRYSASHVFPIFKRMGFDTIEQYLDRHTWKFSFDKVNNILKYSGTRHVYTSIPPVVDPVTNELFMNLYPIASPAIIKIAENDSRFFGAV